MNEDVQEARRPIHMNIYQWKMNIDYNKNYIPLTKKSWFAKTIIMDLTNFPLSKVCKLHNLCYDYE